MATKLKARAVRNTFKIVPTKAGDEIFHLQFETAEGTFPWTGFLSDNSLGKDGLTSFERTMRSLEHAGCTDITDLVNLPGLGSVECWVTIDDKEYNNVITKVVAFVNHIDDVGAAALTPAEINSFKNKHRSKLQAYLAKKNGATPIRQTNGYERPRQAPPPQQQEHGDIPF